MACLEFTCAVCCPLVFLKSKAGCNQSRPTLVRIMRSLFVNLFFAFACIPSAWCLPPGIKNALYGSMVDASDFEIRLNTPKQDPSEIRWDIDGVAKLESIRYAEAEAHFARRKQQIVNAGREKVAALVKNAMQTLTR